jgi:uncharacterized membrane protein (DUF106 family)
MTMPATSSLPLVGWVGWLLLCVGAMGQVTTAVMDG